MWLSPGMKNATLFQFLYCRVMQLNRKHPNAQDEAEMEVHNQALLPVVLQQLL